MEAMIEVKPGMWAEHKDGTLDPRLVARVDATNGLVWLDILGSEAGPFPIENYTYSNPTR